MCRPRVCLPAGRDKAVDRARQGRSTGRKYAYPDQPHPTPGCPCSPPWLIPNLATSSTVRGSDDAYPPGWSACWHRGRLPSALGRDTPQIWPAWDSELVPAVDTIEALTAAAEAFDTTPLGLQVDPDADAAVRESLQRTGLVLLGEAHGRAQPPVLADELIAWFGLGGIALEWDEKLRRWLNRWIADGVLTDPLWG